MQTITATAANRSFSKLLNEVATNGEAFTIVRLGKPIATLAPTALKAQSQDAWHTFLDALLHQEPLGGPACTRDEIYEDALC